MSHLAVPRGRGGGGGGQQEEPAADRARRRTELVDRWLPEIVDEVLQEPEIAAGLTRAGLDRAELAEQVLAAREEVLTPADQLLDRAVDAALAAPADWRPVEPDHGLGIAMMVLGGVMVAGAVVGLFLWDGVPWWAVAGSLLLVSLGGLIALGGREAYRGRPPYRVTNAETALARWRQACREDGVLPFVRRVLNAHVAPHARTSLGVTTADAPGLQGGGESTYVVRTESVTAFLAAARRLPTGAIGLAGRRGVGKTSLIEHFAGRASDEDHPYRPLKVTVSAPVQYEPREFVLHLFASVCRAVLRERGAVRRAPEWFLVLWRPLRFLLLAAATVVAAVVAGGADVLDPARLAEEVRAPNLWLVPAAALAVVLVLDVASWLRQTVRRRHEDDGVLALARQHLENIHYLQTHTTGWSGKVALPGGSDAGWSRTRQRERRPQTYPEVVTALRDFLAAVAQYEGATPAVIIAVDELDKIETAERAQQFVNEIKSVFGAQGTQFLVSVSEDALASFERRGMPVRDAFDSAFHEIVRVDHLSLADTAQLLASRVIGLPEPFTWLVHCLSGGLPRDVVRTARAMVALTEPGTPGPLLDEVCAELVADDLRRKSHAFQLACRDLGDGPEVTEFIRTLRRLPGRPDELLALVPKLRMGELGRQAGAYVYYAATLLAVFTHERVDERDPATFDKLAQARQSLAVHPRLAWLLVDEFRTAWDLDLVPVD